MPMTIRSRVTGALLMLIAMAAAEALIVIVQHRAIQRALAEQARTGEIRLHVQQLSGALAAAQAAQRGVLITGDPRERAAFDSRAIEIRQVASQTRPRFVDAEQSRIFDAIAADADQWLTMSRRMMDDARNGADLTSRIATVTAPAFRELTARLATFERERFSREESASAAFRAQLDRSTLTLTAVPAFGIVVLVALLITTDRRVLRPLGSLARAARRLASGDYSTELPTERPDEVGSLIRAFRQMRASVQERAAAAAAATERQAIANKELLATIDLVPSAIVILNADGSVRLQNRTAKPVLGDPPVTEEERKAYFQRFKFRDSAGRPMRVRDIPPARALAGTETIAEEVDLQRPDGERVVVLVGAVPLRDAGGAIVGAVTGFQDITRLRELDRLKDEFVAIVSHELRTPLAAIRGSLQLVIHDHHDIGGESGELLGVALKSCDRLVRIVNDMLDLSKIEAGKIDLKLAPLSPATAILQAIEEVQALADTAGVRLTPDADAGLPEVLADLDRLTQVLVNLVSNAVKFSPRGSAITIGARPLGDMLEFSVTDHGPGIPADDIARLFQRFQQLDSTATRKAGGTGLGLAIAKGIVTEHGGEIDVDSEPGRGTTFRFTIPLLDASTTAPIVAEPRPPGGAPRILLAEDDTEARMVMRQTLERRGFEVLEAADGRQAIDAARRSRPDLLVLDLRMPGVHGRDVIRILRKHAATSTLPIVVVSGSASERQSLESLVLGANVFLAKPADTDALVADINRLLRRTPPEVRS